MIKDEPLLSRWSRRKLQTLEQSQREDAHIEEPAESSMPQVSTGDPQALQPEHSRVLTDEDMPDLDSLSEDSDFSAFMSPGVSDELRNLALKKLFCAPAFNVCDGLDEYAEDYTSFEPLGNIITCDMKHQLEMEAQKLLASQQADEETVQTVVGIDSPPEEIQGDLPKETRSRELADAEPLSLDAQPDPEPIANEEDELHDRTV